MNHKQTEIFGMPYVSGMARGTLQHGLSSLSNQSIAIITMAEIGSIKTLPAGFIVVEGAPFSHTMIRLLGMGVPTLIISDQQVAKLIPGQEVILDGMRGYITTDLTGCVDEFPTLPACSPGQPLSTQDGIQVHLLASIRNQDSARLAVRNGAEAIGLVRSEFLIPTNNQIPDIKFYQHAFTEVCEAAIPLNVTLRLLDVSADKMPGWLTPLETGGGVLGLQGVRLYNTPALQAVLQAQLTAIKTLSDRFTLRVLIPYLVRHEELMFWVTQVRQQIPEAIPLGAMVETPASALDINQWFDTVDFVAIGCNDLMQCLFAADRDCASLRHYLDPYAPLLYRFLRQITEEAKTHLHQVQICGVLSQLPGILPILLGLGYRTFSVEPTLIPYLTHSVRTTTITQAQQLAAQVCAATTSQQVLELLGLQMEYHRTFLSS